MSQKKQTQKQIILSLVGIFLLFLVSSLFYIIDTTVGNDRDIMSDIKMLDKSDINSVKESDNYVLIDLDIDNNYLSEIKDLHDSLKREEKVSSEILPAENNSVKQVVEVSRIEKRVLEKNGKLAIIIDDVAFKYQVQRLRNLNLPITLSFFPSDINHPQTSKYAKSEIVPMVHFPLEAINFKHAEIDTLRIGDSFEKIEQRVDQILRQFPNLKYTNNHTGSSFTSDYVSMRRLLVILKERNIQFIDSVTTSKSVVKRISKELGIRYMRRDIFIDNILDVSAILRQLKKAIAKAKKNGSAIAIGHPHKATIKALSKIKPLLDGVTLVFINDI